MHKSESLISTIHYGFNDEYLFIRLDPAVPFDSFEEGVTLSVITSKPEQIRITCPVRGEDIRAELFRKVNEEWVKVKDVPDVAIRDIFEIGVTFSDLGARQKDEINLFISIRKGPEDIERCPWRGHITLNVPTPDFEAMMWY
jgi:hypothetical protein